MADTPQASLALRLWRYQGERFPLLLHLPMIVVLVGAGFARAPDGAAMLDAAIALVVLVGLFFQLRVSDEFKDAATDAKYRPERPVPRGLITLKELAGVGVGIAATQFILALVAGLGPTVALLCIWFYGALMAVEFRAGPWLRGHPVLYLLSHMAIMPLIALFPILVVLGRSQDPATGIAPFLLLAFCNGLVLEIGRKIRRPEEEQPGVETYSSLWGPTNAVVSLLVCMSIAAVAAVVTIATDGVGITSGVVLTGILFALGFMAVSATRGGRYGGSKTIQAAAGLWALISFGAVALPLTGVNA